VPVGLFVVTAPRRYQSLGWKMQMIPMEEEE
jgi:hypothetical protein